jgi:hypothetical protein
MTIFANIRPIDTTSDAHYQRDIDEDRILAMAQQFDLSLFGVPVLSRRGNGEHVRIDGQHRLEAAILADRGQEPVLCEVHEGLSLKEEAELFLRLNRERSAVRVYDKYKARLVAGEPVAMAIDGILKALSLKVGKSRQARTVCAVEALEASFPSGKLMQGLRVLTDWRQGDPSAYEGPLIRGMTAFLVEYPDVDAANLVSQLRNHTPAIVHSRFRAKRGELACTPNHAARLVLQEIYNERRPKRHRIRPKLYREDAPGAG